MPPEGSAGEDTRVWIGHISSGREADSDRFRRRLTEYQLTEDNATVTIVFKAPHTGDPRLMIDFLRYPGLWPEYWEFVRGGRAEDEPLPASGTVRVHWRRTD